MVEVNVNLKVPALEKLLDHLASGIGAVAGPMLASWKASREGKARLIEARTEADSLKFIADARSEARQFLVEPDRVVSEMVEVGPDGGITQRIEFQEKKRQANIRSVVRDAAASLGDKEVPDHEPDPDWTARFFDCVQDVSSEDMRKLWAKVLSGEVEEPGRTSLRTLDILKNMTQRDAEIFSRTCGFVIDDWIFYPFEYQTRHPVLSFNNVVHLETIGLAHVAPTLVKTLDFSQQKDHVFRYQEMILKIGAVAGTSPPEIPVVLLTASGNELYRITRAGPHMDYLRSLSRFLKGKNCELSYARILETLPDGRVRHTSLFIQVEPKPEQSDDTMP